MFLFSCCTEGQNSDPFELRAKQQQSQSYTVLSNKQRYSKKFINPSTQVLKVKKSQYRELVGLYKNSKEMWEDPEFPHNSNSLGSLDGVRVSEWKRLSNIIQNPVLFDGKIEPQDAIQGLLGDCYFLSAISALAEKDHRIKAIFGEQQGMKNGIFRVVLRVNGIVQQILVDDYVPVNSKGEPIFCQPNKNQIWVPILEKAWAKANGSYGNIIAGIPSEIFRSMTYAPAETVETGDSDQLQLLWRKILDNAKLDRPCCCGTDDSHEVNWQKINLVPGHAYTLIDAAELETTQGKKVRMLKLRNPWGNTEWEGQGCQKDQRFWSSVQNSEAKNRFLRDFTINNDGIFYINFRDYCKYFSQTHICYLEEQGNYIYENYEPHQKRGMYWTLTVFEQGQYWLETHQNSTRNYENDEQALARITMVLARCKEKGHSMIDGVLAHYQPDCSLRVKLTPGQYTIFTKFDSNQRQRFPLEASVSVYSLHYVFLDKADPIKYKGTLGECMLEHAKATKRKRYENDTMWISWKLMYKEGGYAYICFGAEKEAQSKWSVTFNESDFEFTHFRMKKPWKRKGDNQHFQVLPGSQKIIVVRVKNDTPTTLKWPPKITYKLAPLK